MAVCLQFGDTRFELGDGSGDVGQFDDVGFRLVDQLAQFGQFIFRFAHGGEYAAGQGDVAQFHVDARFGDEFLDDGIE